MEDTGAAQLSPEEEAALRRGCTRFLHWHGNKTPADYLAEIPPDTAADSLSDSLSVQAYALAGAIPANRRVVYAITIFPDSGSVLRLVPKDTVFTNAAGVASTRLRLRPGPVPDSVVVTATMRHVNGTVVPDSVTFVVEFRQ